MTSVLKEVPEAEVYHFHDYHEYYVVLEGRAGLVVDGKSVAMAAGTVVMIHPGEKHSVSWVDPDVGVRWIIIKQRSEPRSKRGVAEGTET
jgi:mannose-6-phosphate isomerase-like protein (cupin superfamily)